MNTDTSQHTILIVDDDLKIRTIYRQMLSEEGFGIDEAANGEEAAICVLRNKNIQLILLDIDMPMVDGPSFFKLARFCVPHAKIFVSSVFHLDEQKTRIPDADGYHDKINGPGSLVSKIKAAIVHA